MKDLLTVVLTHWRRRENVVDIVKALRLQSIEPQIYLWDNQGDGPLDLVDWSIRSSRNVVCWPRWFLASLAATPFVAVMDDDLLWADDGVLADAVAALEELPAGTGLGIAGVQLAQDREYGSCRHVEAHSECDEPVDIVKGRFFLTRTPDLRRLWFEPNPPRHILIADDIIASAALARQRRRVHRLPRILAGRWRDLPSPFALCGESDHYTQREAARRAYFPTERAALATAEGAAARVTRYGDEDLTFLMHIYRDLEAAAVALTCLRKVYPRSRVVLIADGDASEGHFHLAAGFGATMVVSERLFAVERGGEVLRRMLGLYLAEPTRWLFKIDPDTDIHRRFKWLPSEGVFGTFNCELRRSIQGGCLGMARAAAEAIYNARANWIDELADWRAWARNPHTLELESTTVERAMIEGLTSIDWTLAYCCRSLGIPVFPFDEVCSQWKNPPNVEPNQFAVTHPRAPRA